MHFMIIIVFAILFLVLLGFIVYRFLRPAQIPPIKTLREHHFCTVFGHKIHYAQAGHGKDILLIHGIGASHFVWRLLIPLLAKSHRVTAIDLVGFGLSDKPGTFSYDLESQCEMILGFLNQLGISECDLIGSSMGGMIALKLAQLHPEKFPHIVALSPAYDPKITFFDLNKISFLSPVVRPLITEEFVRQIMKRVYSDKSLITKETVAAFSQPYAKSKGAIDSFVKSFRLLRDRSVFDNLPLIRSKTLILWGAKDKIIPIKYAHELHKKIPHSRLEIHPQAGHHVQEDAPEWALEKIFQFISE